jgi:rubrerythrin
MAITFNADEVFGIAENIEANGAKFYRACAENNADGRELLNGLAKMEDEHLATFRKMHKEIAPREAEALAADPDGVAGQYLAAMAGGYVFETKKDPTEMLKGDESLADVLKIAIGLEKDSIVFYLGIRDMVPRSAGKDKVEQVIKEEMKHVVMLTNELKKAG